MRSLLLLAALALHGTPAFNVSGALAPRTVHYDHATSAIIDNGRVVGYMYVHDDELGQNSRLMASKRPEGAPLRAGQGCSQ